MADRQTVLRVRHCHAGLARYFFALRLKTIGGENKCHHPGDKELEDIPPFKRSIENKSPNFFVCTGGEYTVGLYIYCGILHRRVARVVLLWKIEGGRSNFQEFCTESPLLAYDLHLHLT